jgi:two-component system, cell cycle sensor histidine kinase PleC
VTFTPAGGAVCATLGLDADGFVFRVADTGIGIAPHDIPKAMAAFGQVDNVLSRKYEGTGLGLPLVRALAELHGGSFDLDSAVGVGTTVTVRLPRQHAQLAAA